MLPCKFLWVRWQKCNFHKNLNEITVLESPRHSVHGASLRMIMKKPHFLGKCKVGGIVGGCTVTRFSVILHISNFLKFYYCQSQHLGEMLSTGGRGDLSGQLSLLACPDSSNFGRLSHLIPRDYGFGMPQGGPRGVPNP